jgi:hypothetical protein
MLSGPGSAEILARLLTDPDSFTTKDDCLIANLEAKLEATSTVLQPEECARLDDQLLALLNDSTRFSLAVANLKVSLAKQQKALGSN